MKTDLAPRFGVLANLINGTDRVVRSGKLCAAALDRIGARIWEPHLIRHGWQTLLPLSAALLLFLLLISLKVHFSSMDVILNWIPQKPPPTSVVLGRAKAIRSDEWLVHTPFILSQTQSGFPVKNVSIGAGDSPLLVNVPVAHFTAAFKPQHFGFFVLDIERGYSFLWSYRVVGMLLSFFLLFLVLTDNDVFMSLIGAFWVYLSSGIQWWFGTNLSDMLVAFAGICLSAIYLLFATRVLSITVAAFLFVLFSMNLALALYPPYQIAFAYLGIFLLAGYVLRRRTSPELAERLALKGIAYALAGLLLATLLGLFLAEVWDTLKLGMSTVYPGQRRAESGGVPIWRLFTGFYDLFYSQEWLFPPSLGNVSEASNFVALYPLIFLLWFADTIRGTRQNSVVVLLLLFLALLMAWMVFGVPGWINSLLKLEYVTPHRAFPALGIGSILVTIVYLSLRRKSGHGARWAKEQVGFITLAFGLFVMLGYILRLQDPVFFSWRRILLVCFLGTILAFAIKDNRRWLFAIVLGIFLLPGWSTNPLSLGLSPFYGTHIARTLDRIRSDDPDATWIVFGIRSNIVAQAFKAIGVRVFGGVNFLPQLDKLRLLDERGTGAGVYNRYAHIHFMIDKGNDSPRFELAAPDSYLVHVDPCSSSVARLRVDFVAVTDPQRFEGFRCLEPLQVPSNHDIYLFRYRHDSTP